MPYYHYKAENKIKVFDFLKSKTHLPEDEISDLIHFGCLYLNGTRWFPTRDDFLLPNQIIRFHLHPKRYSSEQLKKIRVIQENHNFIAIYKPAGVPSHETLDNCIENAKFYLMSKKKFNLWPLSRLDVGTQGILLFAKNREFANKYNELLNVRKITKIYHCLSHSAAPLASGIYKHWMIKSNKAPKNLLSDTQISQLEQSNFLDCQLELNFSERFDSSIIQNFAVQDLTSIYLNQIRLITGRTHQVRAQMSKLAHPLLGDSLYGSSIQSSCQFECIALACTKILSHELGINIELDFREISW